MSDKRLELTAAQHSRLDRVAESVSGSRVIGNEFIDGQLCPYLQADPYAPIVIVTPKGDIEKVERTKGVL